MFSDRCLSSVLKTHMTICIKYPIGSHALWEGPSISSEVNQGNLLPIGQGSVFAGKNLFLPGKWQKLAKSCFCRFKPATTGKNGINRQLTYNIQANIIRNVSPKFKVKY